MSTYSLAYNEVRLDKQFCDAVIRVDGAEFQVHKIILCNCSQYFSDFMEKQISPQNCIGIWRFTDIYYSPQLREKALLFTLNHFEEVVTTSDEFLVLSANELVRIIESDRFIVKQEKTLYEAILRWIGFAPDQCKEYISRLLSKTMFDLRLNTSDRMFCNPLAHPRLPSTIILAVGRWSEGSPINNIEAYDISAKRWVNIPNVTELPRADHGVAFVDGSVYCVGGCNGSAQFNTVQRFDLTTHTWSELAPMHSYRCYVSVTAMDGYIYAMGGFDGYGRLNSVERYQPTTNQWTLTASMHEQRSNASCMTLHHKIYICGGFSGTECLSSAESYNPRADQWTLIRSMGSRRSGLGAITFAGRIFAVGGFNKTACLQTVEAYDPDTNTWLDMPPMLSVRSSFGISVIDDCLFVVGGYNGFNTTPHVEYYDVKLGVWSDACDMEISRSGLSCCVVYGLNNMAEYAVPRNSLELSSEEEDKRE